MNKAMDQKIGIVGCGHLGRAIAQSLLYNGFKKENLLISYRGNPQTCQKLEAAGLSQCVTDNHELFKEAGIILITTKPQDILKLDDYAISKETIIASCMAGVSADLLNKKFRADVYRMMFSGPDTVMSGNGIATMYPENEYLKALLRKINLTYLKIISEDDLDIFTAGVCLPAAILAGENRREQQREIEKIEEEYPLLSELFSWAKEVLPDFESTDDREAYIQRMLTKGGITDAIVSSLRSGEAFDVALRKGIIRSKEIASEIRESII